MTKINISLAMIVLGIGLASISQVWAASSINDPSRVGLNLMAATIGILGIVLAIRSAIKLHRQHRTSK